MFTLDDVETQNWLNDLVTTKEKQGKSRLGNSKIGYCCLGRECVVNKRQYASFDPYASLIFDGPHSIEPTRSDVWEDESSPGEYMQIREIFATANDDYKMTFKEIALLACFLHETEINP